MYFTTTDQDNDLWDHNCATHAGGAWWHNACHQSHLNGVHYGGATSGTHYKRIQWKAWQYNTGLEFSEMKIRPFVE